MHIWFMFMLYMWRCVHVVQKEKKKEWKCFKLPMYKSNFTGYWIACFCTYFNIKFEEITTEMS